MYAFSNRVETLKPSAIRERMKFMSKPGAISFAQGNPSPETLPYEALKSISAYMFGSNPASFLQYGLTEGYTPLRLTLRERMQRRFSCGEDFDELIIVSGAQQGIELACKMFCNEGDAIVCENPSFIGSLNAFRSYNVQLLGVDVEPDGMNIEQLEETLKKHSNIKLLYTIPNFQNPTGVTMSLEKRKAVYELAKRYNVMILEDNPYGEVRFHGEDIPNIKSLDTEGIVIYVGSFSKVLSAGIRVGYVLAPLEVAQKMVVVKQSADVHTNLFAQVLAERFMNDYNFDGHIAELQKIYGRKCDLMLSCMEEGFGDRVSYNKPEGGLFIWCTLPGDIDPARFSTQCAAAGVTFIPGNMLAISPTDCTDAFRLNFSTPSDQQIVEGIGKISAVLKAL
ncbi:PLP-dependent aminotransferase family protein [Paenibacillus sp. P46E]|uniref:aminotransferase-like domain-containing protein n=1 Tax=Paenibacillus sp. P46E TaxID=1349436 RepID=UPI0009400D82|nr:PLP-dependent aminotransferase family protein [Paenibacillus sp. P46E]OKP95165.1 GntR family transcriptional regulator [Paenibacillus sp. P46E]